MSVSTRSQSVSLVAFAYAASIIGFVPGISLYGQDLKARLQLTQKDLLQIVGVSNLLGIFGALAGSVAEHLGVQGSILVGGLLAAASQTAQYVIAINVIHIPTVAIVPVLVILQVLARSGLMIVDASAFATPVALFRKQRAKVSAIVTCFVPGSVVTGAQVSQVLAADAGLPLAGLLYWPLFTTVVCLSVAMVLPKKLFEDEEGVNTSSRLPSTPSASVIGGLLDTKEEGEDGAGDAVNSLFLILSIFGLLSILRPILHLVSSETVVLVLQYALVLCFFFPISLCCCESMFGCLRARLAPLSLQVRIVEAPKDLRCVEMLRTLKAWLWLIVVAFVFSGSQVFTSSAGQITIAAGRKPEFVNVMMTAWSGGIMSASLLSPFLSDALVKHGVPRTILGFLSSLLTGTGHALLARAALAAIPGPSGPLLLSGAFCIGLGMGTMTVQAGVVVCELFGKRHLTTNFAFYGGVCHGPVPYVFMLIAGVMVDKNTSGSSHTCIGSACFAVVHAILIGGNLVGALAALILTARSSEIYRAVGQQPIKRKSYAILPHTGFE